MYNSRPYTPKKSKKIAVVDIEGFRDFRTDKMLSYLVGVYNPNFDRERYPNWDGFTKFSTMDCVNSFLDKFLTKQFRGYVFYAHFGSIFDFPIILQELNKRNHLKIYPIMKGSKIIKMKVEDNNKHYWFFNDSSALLNFSLDELTKTFKVTHAKLHVTDKNDSYDFNLFKLYKKNPALVIKYLKHDCIGLYEVLDKFKTEMLNIGGDLGLTIASTSLKTFNRKYQNNYLFMCSKEINDELRNAYYGGRTEIFRLYAPELKDSYYYYYDINSLYPFVMRDNDYPISKPNIVLTPDKDIFMETNGITFAKVKAPDDLYIPILPSKIKMKSDTKLMFVLGNYEGWWDNHLLRKAKEIGYQIEPMKSYVFRTDYIFKEFVNDFYKIKQNAERDTPMYLIAKLLMNSLYGKFGQRQISESLIKDPFPDPEKYKLKEIVDFDSGWCKVEEEGKGKMYLPQIAVHVTAMAQLWLYKSLEDIVNKGYKIFYCDTDSITTDYRNMHTSKELGDWKLEKRILEGYFVLPKTYKTVDENGKVELRAKGYSRKLQQKIKEDAFRNAIFKNDMTGFKVMSDKKELMRAKASFRRYHEFNHLDYIRRSLQTTYNKRKILNDFNTRPFKYKELIK
jgi:hypothetical protein